MVKALTNEDFERLMESFNNSKNIQIINEKPVENRKDLNMIDAVNTSFSVSNSAQENLASKQTKLEFFVF